MSIIDRFIKFLGLFTNKEYSLINLEYNNQRDLVSFYRARVDYLEKELSSQNEERKFLQDLIFKRFGVVVSEENPQSEETFQPIKTSPRRWSDLKIAMERDDRERVNNVKN